MDQETFDVAFCFPSHRAGAWGHNLPLFAAAVRWFIPVCWVDFNVFKVFQLCKLSKACFFVQSLKGFIVFNFGEALKRAGATHTTIVSDHLTGEGWPLLPGCGREGRV